MSRIAYVYLAKTDEALEFNLKFRYFRRKLKFRVEKCLVT